MHWRTGGVLFLRWVRQKKMKLLLWWIFGVALLALLIGALAPRGALPGGIPLEPPAKHFVAYCCVGLLLTLALRSRLRSGLAAVLFLSALGLGVEILQLWIPGRSFLWLDVAVNVAGAAAGSMFAFAVRRIWGWFRDALDQESGH